MYCKILVIPLILVLYLIYQFLPVILNFFMTVYEVTISFYVNDTCMFIIFIIGVMYASCLIFYALLSNNTYLISLYHFY